MPSLFLVHTILLIIATGGVFFWLSLPGLSVYTLQLVAVLVLLYLGSHYLRDHHPSWFHRNSITSDITILTSMILLLCAESGGLTSPFFFLCYFLLFGVAMLYEIEATLILTGVFILFFLFLPGTNLTGQDGLAHLAQIISLIMVTPLAIFTGHQYEATLEEKRAHAILQKHLGTEETDTLLFLSLNLKRTLISALDSLSIIIPQEKVKTVQSNLKNLYEDLKTLYRSADELERTIDKESDD
jgi:cell division protein FtsW (lipid II flippase)